MTNHDADSRREARIEQIVYGLLHHPEPDMELALITEAIDDAGWIESAGYLATHPDQLERAQARATWRITLRNAIARRDDATAGKMLREAVERYARKVAGARIA